MAVQDYYVNTQLNTGKLADPAQMYGAQPWTLIQNFSVLSTDSAGSIYRIGYNISASMIPSSLEVFNDTLGTSATMSFGFYLHGTGKPVVLTNSQQLFDTTVNMNTARPITGSSYTGLTNITIPQRGLRIADLLGLTDAQKLTGYDFCATLVAAGGTAGNVSVKLNYIQG